MSVFQKIYALIDLSQKDTDDELIFVVLVGISLTYLFQNSTSYIAVVDVI